MGLESHRTAPDDLAGVVDGDGRRLAAQSIQRRLGAAFPQEGTRSTAMICVADDLPTLIDVCCATSVPRLSTDTNHRAVIPEDGHVVEESGVNQSDDLPGVVDGGGVTGIVTSAVGSQLGISEGSALTEYSGVPDCAKSGDAASRSRVATRSV